MRVARFSAIFLATFISSCANHSVTSLSKDDSTIPQSWLGQWNGPEGTFLSISPASKGFEIVIQNLDGPRIFQAVAVDHQLSFERDGKQEKIYATNGIGTGMKWLADKNDCLAIRPGEGFCR